METKQKKYKFSVVATDIVIFTTQNKQLKVLLMKMDKAPFLKHWAAPGGLIKPNESVEEGVRRQLFSKTGLKDVYLEQLYTFGKINRDPFGRVVSVGYFALVPPNGEKLEFKNKPVKLSWFPVTKLPNLAYDHSDIIRTGLARLKAKLGYTNIAYNLLPREITLGELQELYEIILERKLDKRNFRKKILSLGLLKKLSKKKKGEPHRPAELHSFLKRRLQIVEIV